MISQFGMYDFFLVVTNRSSGGPQTPRRRRLCQPQGHQQPRLWAASTSAPAARRRATFSASNTPSVQPGWYGRLSHTGI